jgi:hypothetical protein
VKRAILAAAAIGAAVAVWIALALPPARFDLPQHPDQAAVLPGVFHVHTNRSDGRSSPEEVAAAAARAGLKFVVFTDHGDGTAKPSPPAYHEGVLSIDGLEISTQGGHYAAIDLPVAPYRLGGEARDVLEDVRRLGGFGIVAHPDSPKEDLRWREWNAPFDGIELVNLDSGWRMRVQEASWRTRIALAGSLGAYLFRPAETIANLLGESSVASARWESLSRRRRVVVLAGTDAHAKLALRDVDPGDNQFSVPLPSYEAAFRSLAVYVRPDAALTGDAPADARSVTDAIRRGRVFSALTGIAAPAFLDFSATNDRGTARAGDELPAGGPVTLRIQSNAPAGFSTAVWHGTRRLTADRQEQDFSVEAPAGEGVYRVEIRATDRAQAPIWILSNPIYVRAAEPTVAATPRSRATEERALYTSGEAVGWSIETDPTSLAAFDVTRAVEGQELALRFGLATGGLLGQFAALGVAINGGLAAYDRLTFRARSDKPMRLSVQLRAAVSATEQERWQRSVYLEPDEREITVFFDDVSPIGTTRTFQPPLMNIVSIVFAIDTTNTSPGTSGRVWLRNVRLER